MDQETIDNLKLTLGIPEDKKEKVETLRPISEWDEETRKSFEEFCEWGKRNCK